MISAQLVLGLNQQKENICKNVSCLWNNELGRHIIVTCIFIAHQTNGHMSDDKTTSRVPPLTHATIQSKHDSNRKQLVMTMVLEILNELIRIH